MSTLTQLNTLPSEHIQSLWSGYGAIKRVYLDEHAGHSVIVKHVKLPEEVAHPRGWNTKLSHQRKIHSYQVESAWYAAYANQCDSACRVPKCLDIKSTQYEFFIVLEDLDAAGYPVRHDTLKPEQMVVCLEWLAHFHATFMHCSPTSNVEQQLWPVGTYWHLDTRPDELEALGDCELKNLASAIDQKLSNARHQTYVHGDAKLANFCFSEDGRDVAAVDFQYVGGGCGMKDVAYFIGSCLYEDDCTAHESFLLDHYFHTLDKALQQRHPEIDRAAIRDEWRSLFSYAWADFHRFVLGWNPGHWKINTYSQSKTHQVLAELRQAT